MFDQTMKKVLKTQKPTWDVTAAHWVNWPANWFKLVCMDNEHNADL